MSMPWPKRLTKRCSTLQTARELKEPRSVALLGNAAEVLPELLARGISVDVLTDQTSAHDTLNGYVPAHMPYEEALRLRARRPGQYIQLARESIVEHVQRDDGIDAQGGRDVRLRQQHSRGGAGQQVSRTRSISPDLSPNTSGRCSATAKGLSAGRRSPATRPTFDRTDRAVLETFPENRRPGAMDHEGTASRCISRVCRRASAGSATASGRTWGRSSTTWSRAAR